MEDKIISFQGKTVRRLWDDKKEKWYFSVIDIIEVLTGSTIPRRYWTDLKLKLKQDGSKLYEKIVQLKMVSQDGKRYLTDTADTETLFRIIQSIRQIAETEQAKGLKENKIPAKKGGRIAKNARLALEKRTGKKIITGENFKRKLIS